ncbi:YchJ family protein [Hydrogenimonas urashimensis]|uniref:YchJ family protein n=1 Tax=Hydrogenimonas urashimensis TaxID=2740515 RepID=UPI0019161D6F|nr:YchJ family metal-binding protein [Hydrogenimonas urashimensis]
MPDNPNETCPCGSGKTYEACCRRYLQKGLQAPTAEALLRSRYTAYVRGDLDYLVDTDFHEVDKEATEAWMRSTRFYKLEILKIYKGKPLDRKGRIEFKAYFTENGEKRVHHELSDFEKHKGRWYYSGGLAAE